MAHLENGRLFLGIVLEIPISNLEFSKCAIVGTKTNETPYGADNTSHKKTCLDDFPRCLHVTIYLCGMNEEVYFRETNKEGDAQSEHSKREMSMIFHIQPFQLLLRTRFFR